MLEINELYFEIQNLLAKTVADTKPLGVCIKDIGDESIVEPIRIKFNRNYFSTIQLLEGILGQHYKEERGALFVNEALVKFCYLAQMFINCFCIETTLYADNIDYSCFELSIFYVAILNLAKQHKFDKLANNLAQIHLDIFKPENHRSAFTALVNTDVEKYNKRFSQEIKLFEQQFCLHYDATTKGKVTYTYNHNNKSSAANYLQLFNKLCNSRFTHIINN